MYKTKEIANYALTYMHKYNQGSPVGVRKSKFISKCKTTNTKISKHQDLYPSYRAYTYQMGKLYRVAFYHEVP